MRRHKTGLTPGRDPIMTRSEHKPQLFTLLSQPRLGTWLAADLTRRISFYTTAFILFSFICVHLSEISLGFLFPLF